MKCNFCLMVISLIVMGLLLSACAGAFAPSAGNCREGICVRISFSEPVRLNEPVKVMLTIESEKDEDELTASVGSSHRYATFVEGQRNWHVNTKGHQPVQVTTSIRFTEEGFFGIIGGVVSRQGITVDDFVTVHVTRAGVTIYPSGTKIPITPEPLPTITPGPSPTFGPQYTVVPVPSSRPTLAPQPRLTGTLIPTPIQKSYP